MRKLIAQRPSSALCSSDRKIPETFDVFLGSVAPMGYALDYHLKAESC